MNHDGTKAQRHEESNRLAGEFPPVEAEIEALAKRVIGAAIEVHQAIGPGFPEYAYEKALSLELEAKHIRHTCQHPVSVIYRGTQVAEGRLDMLIEDALVVELKAVEALTDTHKAQVVAYLKASELRLGLLINFNAAALKDGLRRVIR
jgi:GxxExxY protein